MLWQFDSDYRLAPGFSWTPSYGPALTPAGRLYIAGGGGTVLYTDNVDTPGAHAFTRLAFYDIANYNHTPAAFDADIQICSPLTSDSHGNIFFGFRATGANPLGIVSGFARIDPSGSGSYVTAAAATSEPAAITTMNCTPALSNDEQTVYVAMRRTGAIATSPRYLVALDATTLATQAKVVLVDPYTVPTTNASLPDDGTASPMVAPDGRVFFGILERPFASNGQRGWLLQFSPSLVQINPPGAFGWDNTPSIVPASAVPSYTGTSPYLLMAKYNNYAGSGVAPIAIGDGVNELAILDPNDSQVDVRSGRTIMKEVLTIAGVTPDQDAIAFYPNAVREWCINSAVVDPFRRCVLAGSEDGVLYRWDLTTNTFSESKVLTPGLGEAYTPTLIGRDGKVYAINNATLFAVGVDFVAGVPAGPSAVRTPELASPQPTPFIDATTMHFSLPQSARVELSILDASGRRIARLVDGGLPAGEHVASWDGRDDAGRRGATGVYFARLRAGAFTATRKLVLTR